MLAKDEPLPTNKVDLSGVKVAYTDEGKGEAILFVHGIPTSGYLWRNVIRELDKDFRCVAPDLMGLGHTDTPPSHRYDMEAQAAKLLELAGHLGLDTFTLVCHDQGGAAAQWLAVNHPERIDRFILTNCVCYDNWPVPVVAKAMKAMRFKPLFALNHLLGGTTRWAVSPNGMRQGVYDKDKFSNDAILEYMDFKRKGPDKHEQFRLFALAGDCKYSVEAAQKFGQFHKPTMVLWAGNDPWLSVSWGRQLYDDIAGAQRMDIIPWCGHFWQEEKPEVGAAYIREFMQET